MGGLSFVNKPGVQCLPLCTALVLAGSVSRPPAPTGVFREGLCPSSSPTRLVSLIAGSLRSPVILVALIVLSLTGCEQNGNAENGPLVTKSRSQAVEASCPATAAVTTA